MAQKWSGWCVQLGLASSLAIGYAIANSGDCAFAQLNITPDDSLGTTEKSKVTPDLLDPLVDRVEGGAIRGANLFHSFSEFNIRQGRAVDFANPAGVQNILSRVTGSDPSDILGKLGVSGNANLFLINPNGIIFGPNASLDVRGSFMASTASRLNFADGNQFNATAHPTKPLLTVSVPIGLQSGGTAGGIRVQGSGLSVQPGKTLALVGGDVTLEGGDLAASGEPNLVAKGGRIELGSVAAVGEVSLNQRGNSWVLGYDSVDAFGDIKLEDEAFVDASGKGGGDIQIQGDQLDLSEGSYIFADTEGTEAGGEVFVHTTGAIALSDGSLITADVYGSGPGGNLTIETGEIALSDDSSITADVYGSGTGGDLTIETGEIALSDDSSITADVLKTATGTGGNLTIETRQLSIRGDESLVSASNYGPGKGGDLTVTASNSVELVGLDSGLFTRTEGGGTAGDLTITTGQLLVQDGAQVSASTADTGPGGTLAVSAPESVRLIGTSADGFPSSLFTRTEGAGTAGDLTITTGQLLVQDGAQVSASTAGTGPGGTLAVSAPESVRLIGTSADGFPSSLFTRTEGAGTAGDLTITTGQLLVQDGAQVSALTAGTGLGGTLAVTASDAVELVGISSRLFTQTEGAGTAGDLRIATRQLSVQNGAQVASATGSNSEGNGGDLAVTASDAVELVGIGSGLFTQTEGAGTAGDLTIATRQLSVQNGAQVASATGSNSEGNGGDLAVTASDAVELMGISSPDGQVPSSLFTQTNGVRDAGNLTITTRRLIVGDGAQVSAATFGQGNGGKLRVSASNSVNIFGVGLNRSPSGLFTRTSTGGGQAGNITVDTSAFRIADGAIVDARTLTAGNGGNIMVKADTFEAVNGGQLFASAFRDSSGRAGNITVNTTDSVSISGSAPTSRRVRIGGELFIEDEPATSGLFVRSQGSGNAGELQLTARSIRLENLGEITAQTASGQGGDIKLQAQDLLLLRRGSKISTTAGAGGDGGNITINTPFIVAVPSENSDITANANQGKGGFIQITAQGVFGIERREQLTQLSDITAFSQQNPELNGVVEINTPDVDPSRGLVVLPAELVDVTGLIAQGCPVGGGNEGRGESEFIITGRGGLPPQPGEALRTSAVAIDQNTVEAEVENRKAEVNSMPVTHSTPAPLVEAQGWVLNAQGQVVLTASAPTVTPNSSKSTAPQCHAS